VIASRCRGTAEMEVGAMDPLTHVCSGLLLGQAIRPASALRLSTLLILGAAAFAPDLDAISYLWGADVYGRVHHFYTHTLPGLAVTAAVLAGVETLWVPGISFARLFLLNAAGVTLHLLGDLVAVWPLRILWPWSERDFVLRWTGDFDLAVLVVVGLATGLAATDNLRAHARWIALAVAAILAAYFLFFDGAAGLHA
jgi:membrane-bound metal-dependent hydrolase YbcI (DUF457 family)